jgi:hypothetical protein
MLVNAFIVAYLVFALFWDAPETNLIDRKLKAALRNTIVRLGLSYRWNMYSGPFKQIVELEARLRQADGTIEVVPLPSRYEFRRYAFMLARQRSERLYQCLADYLASRLPPSVRHPTEIVIVRRVANPPARIGGWWRGRFDVERAPAFQESIVARRALS